MMAAECSIDGCSRAVQARGYCFPHYKRWWRHGDPTAGGTRHGEALQYLQDVVLKYDGDECLVWPYARNSTGYGQVVIPEKGRKLVSRVVCEIVNGPPPHTLDEAAHSCGNGSGGCCTPRHLTWKDRSGNEIDKISHGTSNRGIANGHAKLTEDAALEIYSLRGKESQASLAARFCVSPKTIESIHKGKNWGWLTVANDNGERVAA